MKQSTTQRGFSLIEFEDSYGLGCNIQESSNAGGSHIWLGVKDAEPKILAHDAMGLGLPTNGETTGWVPYEIPSQVFLNTRMHLDTKQVKDLIKVLEIWVESGELVDPKKTKMSNDTRSYISGVCLGIALMCGVVLVLGALGYIQ